MVIANTMMQVFPQVTMWRGDFFSERPITAIIGYKNKAGIDPELLVKNVRYLPKYKDETDEFVKTLILLFYCGNLTANKHLFYEVPINTDNLPLVEYLAPISHRNRRAKLSTSFTSKSLAMFYEKLLAHTQPKDDPFLKLFHKKDLTAVTAGLIYYKGCMFKENEELEQAEYWYKEFFMQFPLHLAEELVDEGFHYLAAE